MSSAASLWDDDDAVVENVPKRHKTPLADSDSDQDSPRPTKRPRQTLFLPGSDDENPDANVPTRLAASAAAPENDIDIDAIFDCLDDDDDGLSSKPLAAVDADELERREQARFRKANPGGLHQIMPSSSPTRPGPGESRKGGKNDKDGDEKKPKRRPVLLNETLLLGPTGFPELIKNVKDFKIKGKGHEASDLNRLLGIYQFWTHSLYPKTQFKDTVARVEKLCHSRRMQVALSVWKDEAKGIHHQPESDDEDENMDEGAEDDARTLPVASRSSSAAPSATSRHSSLPPAVPASRPPSSASEYDDIFDEDLDALLQPDFAAAASKATNSSTQLTRSTSKSSMGTTTTAPTEDDDFWADMAEMDQDQPAVPSKPPAATASATKDVNMDDDDQEMWDIFDQVSAETNAAAAKAAPAPAAMPKPDPPAPPPPAPEQYADPSDWDDMYM